MTVFDAPSRCSGSQGVAFRWYGFPPCASDDVEAAVDVLFNCLVKPGRVWSPHARVMAKAEFRQRIRKAGHGRLRPVDEVKAIDAKNPPPLYEIRWQHIPVTQRDAEGSLSYEQTIVRMYHTEPLNVPGYFVGHHAHEKDVTAEDVNAAQQAEINIAIAWHEHGKDSSWGIESAKQ